MRPADRTRIDAKIQLHREVWLAFINNGGIEAMVAAGSESTSQQSMAVSGLLANGYVAIDEIIDGEGYTQPPGLALVPVDAPEAEPGEETA